MQLLKHKRAHLPLLLLLRHYLIVNDVVILLNNINYYKYEHSISELRTYIEWENFLTKAPHIKMLLKFIHVLLMLHKEDEEARLQARHVLPSRQMNYCHFPCFTHVTWYGSLINIEYSKFLIYYTRGKCGVLDEKKRKSLITISYLAINFLCCFYEQRRQ